MLWQQRDLRIIQNFSSYPFYFPRSVNFLPVKGPPGLGFSTHPTTALVFERLAGHGHLFWQAENAVSREVLLQIPHCSSQNIGAQCEVN